MRKLVIMAFMGVGAALLARAAEPGTVAFVRVDPAQELGKIKLMNSVNNGPAVAPVRGDQKRGNFEAYRAARFPMARLHDSINCVSGGPALCGHREWAARFLNRKSQRRYRLKFADSYYGEMTHYGLYRLATARTWI